MKTELTNFSAFKQLSNWILDIVEIPHLQTYIYVSNSYLHSEDFFVNHIPDLPNSSFVYAESRDLDLDIDLNLGLDEREGLTPWLDTGYI